MAIEGDAAAIDSMIKAVGVPFSFDGQEGFCIEDAADEESYSTDAMTFTGKIRMLTVRTVLWPGLANGSSVVVDGVTKSVVQVRQMDDGALTRAYVKTV